MIKTIGEGQKLAKTKKRPQFDCDVNGSIMVVSALRYALGRMTYVPVAVQDWIKTYWDSLDSNTKFNIVTDVFHHLHDEYESKNEPLFGGYDLKEWEKFGIDRYWQLDYNNRKTIDFRFTESNRHKDWYKSVMMKKLYWNSQNEL